MSYWNYRVIRKHHKESDTNTYQIHEVYYKEDGAIEGWTESAVEPLGEIPDELREDIRFFMKAFQKPILEEQVKDKKPILVADDNSQQINEGHYFELMDRASVAVDYIYQFLGCHPLMRSESRLHGLYQQAEKALAELYQEAGRLEYEHTEKSSLSVKGSDS